MAPASASREAPPRKAAGTTAGRDHRQTFLVLLVGMALLVVLAWLFTWGAVKILAGGRAYVHGEGRWSKAQQEVVFFLDRYAERGRPEDLARARAALEVPLGDRRARRALQGDAYDPERARAGFLRGENAPSDVPTMIWLLEHFEHAPYFREAIGVWARADRDILLLRDIADRLAGQWRDAAGGSPDTTAIRAELARTDQRLRRFETEFSSTLNDGLRLLELTVVGTGAALMLIIFALALSMFRWATRHIRASEQKFWASFAHAPIGFALVSRDGRCTEINETLCRQLGFTRDQLLGRSAMRLLHPEDEDRFAAALDATANGARELELRCRHADGHDVWSEAHVCPLPLSAGSDEAFAVLIKDIAREKRDRERLTYEASHDRLTGLFNRARFESELSAAVSRASGESPHVLGFVDLDHFKPINDTCGHSAGDEALKSLAVLMREQLRASDVLARLGGDEFAFLLRNCPIERGELIAGKLCRAVAGYRFEHAGRRFPVSASIGLIRIGGGTADLGAAMRHVDEACYRAKDAGGDRAVVAQADTGEG